MIEFVILAKSVEEESLVDVSDQHGSTAIDAAKCSLCYVLVLFFACLLKRSLLRKAQSVAVRRAGMICLFLFSSSLPRVGFTRSCKICKHTHTHTHTVCCIFVEFFFVRSVVGCSLKPLELSKMDGSKMEICIMDGIRL